MTLKFDGWPPKIIGPLFYTTWSFLHHFKSISEFKLELQSGNTQFGSKLTFFLSHVTLKFDGWPWKTIGHLFHATSNFVHHFVAIGKFKLELQSGNAQSGSNLRFLEPCDLEIWWMTLKNNRTHLLCYFKLCASFCSHWWIQTGVTVWKCPIWVKFDDFLSVWPWNLTDDLEKQKGTSPQQHQALCFISSSSSGVTVQKRLNWVWTSVTLTFDLWPWPCAWTLPWSLIITLDNFMMLLWWKHSEKGVIDGQTDRKYHSLSCLVAAKMDWTSCYGPPNDFCLQSCLYHPSFIYHFSSQMSLHWNSIFICSTLYCQIP